MANPEHLEILKQGAQFWNRWRRKHPEAKPDLNGADLQGVHLSGDFRARRSNRRLNLSRASLVAANLRGAFFADVDLTQADLGRANLVEAHVLFADLSWTNLVQANLRAADLKDSELVGAKLVRADLTYARFTRTYLFSTDFEEALMADTSFSCADLSGAERLETVRHKGPTSIDIDTIYLSKGNIPEAFLRGAGVPEDFIVYMKSLAGNPIEFYSCFISYSSQDDEFARRLHAKVT